jgi:membrane-associated protease RseP (regulator of RpoE activity)
VKQPRTAPEAAAPERAPEPDTDVAAVSRSSLGRSALLFALTLASVLYTGHAVWGSAVPFAATLLGILVVHEAGHYVAARLHGERASLPYFLPFPLLSPFGTLGALIFMGERIRTRRALLDIGAAGPLAGLAVAIPLALLGIALSPVGPQAAGGYIQEGQSLLYVFLKWCVHGPIPSGHDIQMHPVLLAAWGGFFVTFLNLLPVGQLDGGHVGYALWGKPFHRAARWLAWLPALAMLYNAVAFGLPLITAWAAEAPASELSALQRTALSATLGWATFAVLILVMRRVSGLEHPPTDDDVAPLGLGRRLVGYLTLAFFVLLLMPTPWAEH